ncbi:MAG: alpha/beta hydrolase [Planctomycetes bacterium]|nr:alpha/beta hydrolase [Planctomycetota bacterium]
MSRATGITDVGPRRTALAVWAAMAMIGLAVIGIAGCASQKSASLRSAPRNPLADQLQLGSWGGPKPSERTTQVLRRYDLLDDLEGDQQKLLDQLQVFVARDPSPENYHAFAELAFLAGKKIESDDQRRALDFYEASAAHSYMYLFDERIGRVRNPYDPQFRGACDLYNTSLESAMRIIKKHGSLMPGHSHTVDSASQAWEVTIVARGNTWRPEDFERFEFVSDYEVNGLTNHYQTYGLGVPLIAVRRKPEQPTESDKFYPEGLTLPVTAFLRVMPGSGPTGPDGVARRQVLLELYDPLSSSDIVCDRLRVPLESDLSTSLAYFLDNPQLAVLPTAGLLRPDLSQEVRGLYFVHPYEPGKIPVVMVHGLFSSPVTWMDMFNDLLGAPEIRERYQFWFYLYPSGQPFWISAAQFRQDLAKMREVLDPQHREPMLDQMVLVGHSMGGLVSTLQTIESGEEFWRIVSDRPFDEVRATPEVRQGLANVLFFHPNPSIRRVITIGTPHRGSSFANETTRYLGRKLITLPQQLAAGQQQLYRDNPDVFRDKTLLNVTTSLDSLAPDSPILPVMLAAQRPPTVKYHNIVGVIDRPGFVGRLAADSDGVVSSASAHLDNVASEIVVNADHIHVHRHPLAVLEVRRILLEHLAELDTVPRIRPPQYYTASGPVAFDRGGP